jgi:hypothetical protein
MKLPSDREVYDPVTVEFKLKTKLQKFSCYYPHQRIMDKFHEKNCDTLAVSLWKKAYPDIDHELVVSSLFGEREGAVTKHLKGTPHLDPLDLSFHPDYTYSRDETLKLLIKN